MLNISKYHKLIVGCSAIATATISGFVQSAEAAGQLNNQATRSNSSTTLIAGNDSNAGGAGGGLNGSNAGGNNSNAGGPGITVKGGEFGPYYYDSNNGGVVPKGNGPFYYGKGPNGVDGYYPYESGKGQEYYFGKGPQGLGYYSYNVNAASGGNNSNAGGKAPGIFVPGPNGPYYYDSNNGGAVPNGNGPFYYGKGPNGVYGYYPYESGRGQQYYYGKGPQGLGYYAYNVNAVNGSDAGAVGSAPSSPGTIGGIATGPNGTGPGSNGRGPGGGGYSSSQIARSQALGSRISIASGKYDIALAALAAAEANQTNTSSKTSPVRYGREVADASTCGCLNSDTASGGDMNKELVAAKQAEADAAAELAAAKAEARTFLESVKGSESGGSGTYQPIW